MFGAKDTGQRRRRGKYVRHKIDGKGGYTTVEDQRIGQRRHLNWRLAGHPTSDRRQVNTYKGRRSADTTPAEQGTPKVEHRPFWHVAPAPTMTDADIIEAFRSGGTMIATWEQYNDALRRVVHVLRALPRWVEALREVRTNLLAGSAHEEWPSIKTLDAVLAEMEQPLG